MQPYYSGVKTVNYANQNLSKASVYDSENFLTYWKLVH